MNITKGVYVAVLNQGEIHISLSNWLHKITRQDKYNVLVKYFNYKPISYNRHKIIEDFLKTDMDYLLMVDSDIIPPENTLELVDFDKDVIGTLCFAYISSKIVPLMLQKNPQNDEYKKYIVKPFTNEDGLMECDAIGSGCMIIRRDVLTSGKIKAPFINIYDENGMKIEGLDLAFCRKAKEAGYKVWCHTDYVASHHVTCDLKELYTSMSKHEEGAFKEIQL